MGESIDQGVEREIREETGLETKFKGILGMREMSVGFRFGQGDMYFPCLMDLVDKSKTEIQLQQHEIGCAEWMPFDKLDGLKYQAIAGYVVEELILPSVKEGKDITSVIDTMTMGKTEKEVRGQVHDYYTMTENC